MTKTSATRKHVPDSAGIGKNQFKSCLPTGGTQQSALRSSRCMKYWTATIEGFGES